MRVRKKPSEKSRATQREWRRLNKGKVRAHDKKWKEKNKERVKAYQRKYQNKPLVKLRFITIDRIRRGLPEPTRKEPALCECCGEKPNGRGKAMHLDHEHTSGLFRGWLCQSCNLGIGQLGDTLDSVRKAVYYLERFYLEKRP